MLFLLRRSRNLGLIGIFSPYRYQGHYLIDGGAVNPVPASILAERGANIVIASSVIPSIEEKRARGQTPTKQDQSPSFLGVLSNMMAIMEREIIKTQQNPVDILIKPKVEGLAAMAYDQAEEFIRLGREAAQEQLPHIEKELYN